MSNKKNNNISGDEIYKWREEDGKSYVEIKKIYDYRGINVSLGTIKNRYKEACEKKGKKLVDLRRIEDEEQIKGRIYNLKSEGKSLRAITKIFRSEGNNIATRTVNDYWKIICKEKGITDEIGSKVKDRIYELRKSGLSYKTIYIKLKNEKIIISLDKLTKICKEIFIAKGEKEPNLNRGRRSWKKNKIGKDDSNSTNAKKEELDEIFNLRQLGNSYRKIHLIFKEKGRKISPITVKRYCKIIYREKGLEEPKNGKKNEIIDEEIYNLRKKGYSYNAISKFLKDKGIMISSVTIGVRCKEIFRAKGEKEPVSVYCIVNEKGDKVIKYGNGRYFSRGKKKPKKSIIGKEKNVDEEGKKNIEKIIKMRRQGAKLQEILDTLNGDGIEISFYKVWKACKDEFGVGFSWKKEKFGNRIYELRQNGNSYNMIRKSLENEGVSLNLLVVRDMCKKIYKEKGEIEPILKGGRKKIKESNKKREKQNEQALKDEICRLRKEGKTFKEIAEECQAKGYKCSSAKAEYVCKRAFKEKGEEVPKAKSKKEQKKTNVANKMLEDEIYRLRKEGKTFKEIADECQGKGYKCSTSKVQYVCKRIFKEKGEELPKAKRKKGTKTINVTEEIKKQSSGGESLSELKNELESKLVQKIESEELLAQYESIANKFGENADKVDRKIKAEEKKDTDEVEIN